MPEPPRRPGFRRYLGRFPGELPAVRDARDWLSRRMELTRVPEDAVQDALLILSELATNALLHSPTRDRCRAFLVSVFVSGNCLRVSVRGRDDTHTPPLRAVPADHESEHGRGLLLVNALADTWGVEHTRHGPAVYFTLAWGAPPPVQAPRQRTARTHVSPQPPKVPAPRAALQHPGGW